VYAYKYAYIKKHIYIYLYTHINALTDWVIEAPKRILQTHVCIHIYTHTIFYIHVCIDIYQFIYVHIYISVRVYLYVANMNIFWNTYISLYIFKQMSSQEEELKYSRKTQVCVYMCVWIFRYFCIYIYENVWSIWKNLTDIFLCTYTFIHMYMCIFISICIYVYMYIYIYIYIYVCIYMHENMRIWKNTYIYHTDARRGRIEVLKTAFRHDKNIFTYLRIRLFACMSIYTYMYPNRYAHRRRGWRSTFMCIYMYACTWICLHV